MTDTPNDNDKIHRAQLYQASELLDLILTGNMPAERNPQALWQAVARHRASMPGLRIRLVGTIDLTVVASVRDAAHEVVEVDVTVIGHGSAFV